MPPHIPTGSPISWMPSHGPYRSWAPRSQRCSSRSSLCAPKKSSKAQNRFRQVTTMTPGRLERLRYPQARSPNAARKLRTRSWLLERCRGFSNFCGTNHSVFDGSYLVLIMFPSQRGSRKCDRTRHTGRFAARDATGCMAGRVHSRRDARCSWCSCQRRPQANPIVRRCSAC